MNRNDNGKNREEHIHRHTRNRRTYDMEKKIINSIDVTDSEVKKGKNRL